MRFNDMDDLAEHFRPTGFAVCRRSKPLKAHTPNMPNTAAGDNARKVSTCPAYSRTSNYAV